MKKITSKKLLNYGAMSAALLAGANASGQIVFTDIADTDVTAAGSIEIDLNADGIVDFTPAAGATAAVLYTGTPSSAGTNAIVGLSAFGYGYASNLAQDAMIDASSPLAADGLRGDLNFNGCAYSNSQFCGGVTDGYAGLVFRLAGNTHYGWMRLDLNADGSGYIVKSFAYNATPDEAILAGQQSLSVDDFTSNTFSHSYNKDTDKLTLESSGSPLSNVELFNILGQRVINQSLSQSNEVIDMSSLKDGIYLAKVSVQGQTQTIKILKH